MNTLFSRIWLISLVVVAAGAWSSDGFAYPFMMRHGFAKCASCHTDPSGGETLSHMGRVQSDLLLSTRWSDHPYPEDGAKFLFGAIEEPDPLRLGGSFRFMNVFSDGEVSSFPMQLDAYGELDLGALRAGGSIGVAKVDAGSPHARAAQVTGGQGDDLNLISRTHYLGVDMADGLLLRLGRLNLPFGLRIPEHVMWAREATRTDRESDQQHGLAVAFNRGPWRAEFMAIAGNFQVHPDAFRERGYSGYFEHLFSRDFAAGLSSLYTRAIYDRVELTRATTRQAHGVIARYVLAKPVVVMLEADILKTTGRGIGYTGLLQADLEVLQGLHIMATGEALEQGQRDGAGPLPGFGEPRFGVWGSINWFFMTHFDARVDVVARSNTALAIQSQMHFYF